MPYPYNALSGERYSSWKQLRKPREEDQRAVHIQKTLWQVLDNCRWHFTIGGLHTVLLHKRFTQKIFHTLLNRFLQQTCVRTPVTKRKQQTHLQYDPFKLFAFLANSQPAFLYSNIYTKNRLCVSWRKDLNIYNMPIQHFKTIVWTRHRSSRKGLEYTRALALHSQIMSTSNLKAWYFG